MTTATNKAETTSHTLNIAVFGASGAVGRRFVAEAARRDHRVTAIARTEPEPGTHPGPVNNLIRDVEHASDLATISAQHDLVLSALRPRNGHEQMMVDLTAHVVDAAIESGTRFIIVGGAAPLRLPDDPEHTVLSAPGFLPSAYVEIARASQQQHDWALGRLGTLGTYACPPAMLVPGERTGVYRTGEDTLVTDSNGDSQISMEDFAVALVDEAEHSRHTGRKFTVAY